MDICSRCAKSVGHDPSGLSTPKLCMCVSTGVSSVDDLGNRISESVHIRESDRNSINVPRKPTKVVEICETKPKPTVPKKSSPKCESYLSSSDLPPSSDEEEEASPEFPEDFCTEDSESIDSTSSLPTPLKLVSALKGSREKQGLEQKNLTVTWAPDVYDPIPRSLSPVKNKNLLRSKSKKNNAKNKHKGKAPRGAGGKDRKQLRRVSGNSDSCYRTLDNRDRLICEDDNYGNLVDFDAGSPDSYCGSSFLKRSMGKVHMSVAEAL